jgi:hypothetical protein
MTTPTTCGTASCTAGLRARGCCRTRGATGRNKPTAGTRPRVDVRALTKQDWSEDLRAASPYAGDYPMVPQGLLGDVIQFPRLVDFVTAPSAATFRG